METYLFIRQLKDIRKVMLSTSHKKLYMNSYIFVKDALKENKLNINSCGYAACVCGHVAILNNLENFKIAREHLEDLHKHYGTSYQLEFDDYSGIADKIYLDLKTGCENLLNEYFLSNSLISSYTNDRIYFASRSKVFYEKDLSAINHLNKLHPTPKDVIDYIDLILENLSNHFAHKTHSNK